MSNSENSSKSRRIEPVTIRSVIAEEEPSLSSLGLLETRAPSRVSSSRERSVSVDGSQPTWGGAPLRSEARAAGSAEDTDTLPSVCPAVVLSEGKLVAQRYVIRRFLARGGMGQVYEAHDQVLDEPVALKITTQRGASGVTRLLEELRLARRITHPNVCRVYDAGVHRERDQGSPIHFITMEYLEGHTLRRRLRSGLPSLPQVFGIARQLLIGLCAIHAAGVLHRDFKSENVMLRLPGNGTGQAVIMDFGLAERLEDAAGLGPASGIGAGSHGYMAPEQLENLPLGPETDLFAFGVVMFEMLTGRLPFARDALKLRAPGLPEPAATPPSQLRSDLSPEVDAFVLKCLQRRPSQRYRSAERALAALTRISELTGASTRAASFRLSNGFPSRGDRFRRASPKRAARV